MLLNAFPFSEQQPVIVIIEDGWHGYLEVSLFQWHEGKETSVEEKVELHKPATDWDHETFPGFQQVEKKESKEVKKPGHREKKANRGIGLVTFFCCPLAEIAPDASGKCVLQIYLQSSPAWINYLFSAPWALITSSTLLTSASSWSLRSMLIWVVGNSSSTCKRFLKYYPIPYIDIGL